MRAMILAAGRGERMGHLTQHTPKPLLLVAGKYLIEYAILSLKKAGIQEIIINVSYLGEQIKTALGTGKRYGVSICYSEEKERLETGGGILQALPWLGNGPFLVMSSDIITAYPLKQLQLYALKGLAHLVMVNNPIYNKQGDFGLQQDNIVIDGMPLLTFGSIGVYRPELFDGHKAGYFRLASEVLLPAINKGLVTGELYQGTWYNIGTPRDLDDINQRAREDSNLRPLASETNTLSN